MRITNRSEQESSITDITDITDLEKWLDFGEQSPPLPVSQLEVGSTVALDDSDGAELL